MLKVMKNYLTQGAFLLPIALLVLLSSCLKDETTSYNQSYTEEEYQHLSTVLNLPSEQVDYEVTLARHMLLSGVSRPVISDAKATLGRVLFYDDQLSRNNTVSCASCHKQSLAFSDDKAFSEGFEGNHTKRNSISLAAAANFSSSYDGGGSSFSPSIGFFWDERATSIAEQSTQTIQDPIEMGMDLTTLSQKLRGQQHYEVLFEKAFGSKEITPARITGALQEFLNAFVSAKSRFDEGLNVAQSPSNVFSNFTQQENQGKALFIEHCSSCHGSDMTRQLGGMANNGLDLDYTDNGVGARTGNARDNGIFKIPFLRNIALTAPYMHDGRFATLAQVVEHYNSGIQMHPNLDFRLRGANTPAAKRLNLTEEEKNALVAFLHTLTDHDFVTDSRYSDPFK